MRKAPKPVCHSHWPHALEASSRNWRARVLQLLRPVGPESVLHNEKPPRWGVRASRRRAARPATPEKTPGQHWAPSNKDKIKKKLLQGVERQLYTYFTYIYIYVCVCVCVCVCICIYTSLYTNTQVYNTEGEATKMHCCFRSCSSKYTLNMNKWRALRWEDYVTRGTHACRWVQQAGKSKKWILSRTPWRKSCWHLNLTPRRLISAKFLVTCYISNRKLIHQPNRGNKQKGY